MSQFSDDNHGFSIPYPYLSKEYQNIQDQLERAQYICPLIHEQIEKLVHLNQIADIDLKNPYLDEIIELELAYINEFYIPIHNLDQIFDSDAQKRIVFAYLYELIVKDLINEIIPKLLKRFEITIEDLIVMDAVQLKEKIFSTLKYILDNYNTLYSNLKDKNLSIEFNRSKYIFYLDLFDTDLNLFRDNLLFVILNSYDVVIESLIYKQ